MALDGDEDRDDQARSKAMLLNAFQSEGPTCSSDMSAGDAQVEI